MLECDQIDREQANLHRNHTIKEIARQGTRERCGTAIYSGCLLGSGRYPFLDNDDNIQPSVNGSKVMHLM